MHMHACALVRPIMEYAASVWDPHHLNDIQALEKVQCRAAHWIMNDYNCMVYSVAPAIGSQYTAHKLI